MLKAALVGFGFTLLFIAIPIVHFITGPLAPGIGGFVAGSRAEARPDQAMGIGALMALFMVGPIGIGIAVAAALTGVGALGLFGAGLVLFLYTAALATAGALAGGSAARRHASQD